MSTTVIPTVLDRLQSRARDVHLPKLALRKRSSDHPMAMFAIMAASAFVSMAFVPTTGPAFASFSAPAKLGEDVRTTAKLARIDFKESDIVCRGQTWSAESQECLLMMAKESGIDADRSVRKLAAAEPIGNMPNIF